MLGDDDATIPPPNLPHDASLTFNPAKAGNEATEELGKVEFRESALEPGPRAADAFGETVIPSGGVPREPVPVRAPSSKEGYALEKRIGAGGFGEVWSASQLALRRTVAIKVIRGGSDASERSRVLRRAFRDEALTAAQLDHPNIVPVYDFASDGAGDSMLAMKLVQGVPWNRAIEEEFAAMPAEDFLARHIPILISVAQAVAFAHSRGIIHRDLKPHQVMIGEFGEVLLMDWGLAVNFDPEKLRATRGDLAMGSAPTAAEASSPAGTPAFMAPEQTRHTAEDVGPWTDVYLLGAILFVLLAGTPPRSGRTGVLAFAAAAAGKVDDIAKVSPSGRTLPPDLVELCLQCLAPEAAARPAPALEVVRRLKEHLSGSQSRTESAAIAAEVSERLAHVEDYEECNALGARLDTAAALWPANPEARRLSGALAERYASLALARGDLALAALQARKCADGARDRLLGGVAAAEARIRSRERTRRLAIGTSVALLLSLLGASAYYAQVLERRAEAEAAARRFAEEQKAEAERNFAAAKVQGEGSAALMGYILRELRGAMEEEFADVPGLDERKANQMRHAIAGRVVAPTLEYFRSVDASAWPDDLALPFSQSMQEASGSFRGLGRLEESLELSSATLALRTARLGDDSTPTLAAMASMAITYKELGDVEGALAIELKILAAHERHPQRDEAAYATALNNLGMRYVALGEVERAVYMFTRALEIRERVFGPRSEQVATILVNRSSAYNRLECPDEALADIERGAALREETLGPDAAGTIQARAMMATVLARHSRHAEAIEILQDGARRLERALGEDHAQVGVLYGKLADAQSTFGDHGAALANSDRCVAIITAFYGARHGITADALFERGRVCFGAGLDEWALEDLALSLEIVDELGQGELPANVDRRREYHSICSIIGEHDLAIAGNLAMLAKVQADPLATDDLRLIAGCAVAVSRIRKARELLIANAEDPVALTALREAGAFADANGGINRAGPRGILAQTWMYHLLGREAEAHASYTRLSTMRAPGRLRGSLTREEAALEELARRLGKPLPRGW